MIMGHSGVFYPNITCNQQLNKLNQKKHTQNFDEKTVRNDQSVLCVSV